jgi:hypothetical protein
MRGRGRGNASDHAIEPVRVGGGGVLGGAVCRESAKSSVILSVMIGECDEAILDEEMA